MAEQPATKAGEKGPATRCPHFEGYSVWLKSNGLYVLTENYCPVGQVPEDPNPVPGGPSAMATATAYFPPNKTQERMIMKCVPARKSSS